MRADRFYDFFSCAGSKFGFWDRDIEKVKESKNNIALPDLWCLPEFLLQEDHAGAMDTEMLPLVQEQWCGWRLLCWRHRCCVPVLGCPV